MPPNPTKPSASEPAGASAPVPAPVPAPAPAPAPHSDQIELGMPAVSVRDALIGIFHELQEQRAERKAQNEAIEELAKASWLAYIQEIGRSTLPGVGIRVDQLFVIGIAGAAGLLGSTGDVGAQILARIFGVP